MRIAAKIAIYISKINFMESGSFREIAPAITDFSFPDQELALLTHGIFLEVRRRRNLFLQPRDFKSF